MWTVMTNEMPPMEEMVWLWEEGRGPWVGSRTDEGDGWLWSNSYGHFWWNGKKWDGDQETDDDYQPTHWMRLPGPPKPESQAGESSAASVCSKRDYSAEALEAAKELTAMAAQIICPANSKYKRQWLRWAEAIEVIVKRNDVQSQQYDELLFAVCRKFKDESRHQTALRYIREAESREVAGPAVSEKKE